MFDKNILQAEPEEEAVAQPLPEKQTLTQQLAAEETEVGETSENAEDTAEAETPAEAESPETTDEEPQEATLEDMPTLEELQQNQDIPTEEEVEQTPPTLPEKPPYHERYYLRYNGGERTEPQDLEGTRAFLSGLGFDGGELRQARKGKERAEEFKRNEKGNHQMFCSYCGAPIAGVEFFRLPDGRLRCTSCSSTVIKNKAEVEEICKRVLNDLDTFFGATIDVPINIEVVDERKLKKKVGIPLGTKDSQSVLILGVAISKKKKYSIILENGAPRISLIATFAHELTHIWQYTHWDDKKGFKKCPKSKRLLVYEGMAKWAELQYLYLIGETTVARREEQITRNRQDEYGIGFCLYEERYPLTREAMACEETPFTPDRYPFD